MPRKRKPPGTDGRANNGGVRQGTPGNNYGNRSDLRMPSKEYGQGVRLERAQQAVPMAAAPGVPQPPAGGGQITPEMLAGITRASTTPTLGQPSARPEEPITSGMSFGPGRTPRPAAAQQDFVRDDVEDRLRALYQLHPTRELRELLEQYE